MSLEPILDSVKKNLNAGEIDTALLDLKSAKGMAPDDFRVYYYYGRCYIKKKNYESAIENLEKAYDMNPIGLVAYYLAMTYVTSDQYQKAVDFIEDALELEMSDNIRAGINYFKSGSYMELGDKDKAIEAAEKAVELNQESEQYQSHLDYLKK
jgi:tetratricopeptide (TPR) repeat protein